MYWVEEEAARGDFDFFDTKERIGDNARFTASRYELLALKTRARKGAVAATDIAYQEPTCGLCRRLNVLELQK